MTSPDRTHSRRKGVPPRLRTARSGQPLPATVDLLWFSGSGPTRQRDRRRPHQRHRKHWRRTASGAGEGKQPPTGANPNRLHRPRQSSHQRIRHRSVCTDGWSQHRAQHRLKARSPPVIAACPFNVASGPPIGRNIPGRAPQDRRASLRQHPRRATPLHRDRNRR